CPEKWNRGFLWARSSGRENLSMQESRPFLQHYAMDLYFSGLILKGLWDGPEPVNGADTFVHCVYPASALTSCHQPRMFSREPQVSRAEVLERRRDERLNQPDSVTVWIEQPGDQVEFHAVLVNVSCSGLAIRH